MTTRKNYIDLKQCSGCNQCKFYHYFHYIPAREVKDNSELKVFDLEYIKFSNDHAEVINHTTGTKHIYNGFNWKPTNN